ncbi:MAG TPA: hypothetical protein DHV49_07205, partial [Alphaproteobacteria bacterium]|nr:hypothetical protein [Alphaproteobacteria bacterium]
MSMSPPSSGRRRPLRKGEVWQTFATLLPYLWPRGDRNTKMRVSVAMGMLVSSKVASLFIPILLGQAVDMVSGGNFSLTV